jgi:uncharacterized membrane protein YkvA (DUF1232 family)
MAKSAGHARDLAAGLNRETALALARSVPDVVVLLRRLVRDARVPRRSKLLLLALAGYLALPVDVIPDFLPAIGHLDDAVVVAFALRTIIRSAGPEVVREQWPGSPEALSLVLRLAG